MNQFFFWLEWPKPYRVLYTIGLFLLLAILGYVAYVFWLGNTSTIYWETQGDLEVAQAPIDYFRKYLFEFPIPADTYILIEKFKASNFQINYNAHYIHFGIIIIGLLFILTAISDLSLTYYGFGLAFVVLFIANMQLEILELGTSISDRWMLIITFLAYAPLSYLYYAYWTSTSYFLRFSVYSIITAVLFFYCSGQTALEEPVFHLLGHSLIFPMLAMAGICLFVGHEPIRAIVFIVTNGATKPRGRMRKIWLLSILYFGNLIYGIAHLNFHYDLEIYYLHPFALLIISILLGVWGLRERAEQIHPIMAFAPTGAFLYMGMAMIAASILGFAIANNNEALWEVLQDAILYSHLTLGLSFLGYVFFNFKELIEAGKKVHRVLYKPRKLTYLIAWLFGTVLIVGMHFENSFFMYDQSLAAYHTGMADAEVAEGDLYTAKQYYSIAKTYDPLNHRVHYSLGSMAREENNKDAAYFFFEKGQGKWPSPHAYANMASLNQKQGFSFKALFDLQQAAKEFPESGELLNNLALLYNKTDLADSAYIYFQLAREHASNKEVVESNLFSLWTKYDFYDDLDSIYLNGKPKPYIGTAANELAFLTKIGKVTKEPLNEKWLQDSVLLTPNLCYIYNYALNTATSGDSTALPYLKRFLEVFENEQFDLYLNFAIGHIQYQQGSYGEAFEYLKAAYQEGGRANGYFPDLLGLRFLEHGQYQEAVDYLEQAYERAYEPALFHLAIASAELPDKTASIGYWKELKKMPEYRKNAIDMLRLLVSDSLPSLDLAEEGKTGDILRYRYLHYNQQIEGSEVKDIIARITDSEVKSLVFYERIQECINQRRLGEAGQYLVGFSKIPMTKYTQPYFEQAYLRLTHIQRKLDVDFFNKVEEATYLPYGEGLKDYYKASYYQYKEMNEQAIASYKKAIEQMPYLNKAYIGYSETYSQMNMETEAYNTLLEGIRSNPTSVVLLGEYILKSQELGFRSFAESGIKALEAIATDAEYQAFMEVYKVKKAEMEKVEEDW